MGTFLFQTSRTMPALFLWVTAVASVMFSRPPSAIEAWLVIVARTGMSLVPDCVCKTGSALNVPDLESYRFIALQTVCMITIKQRIESTTTVPVYTVLQYVSMYGYIFGKT